MQGIRFNKEQCLTVLRRDIFHEVAMIHVAHNIHSQYCHERSRDQNDRVLFEPFRKSATNLGDQFDVNKTQLLKVIRSRTYFTGTLFSGALFSRLRRHPSCNDSQLCTNTARSKTMHLISRKRCIQVLQFVFFR